MEKKENSQYQVSRQGGKQSVSASQGRKLLWHRVIKLHNRSLKQWFNEILDHDDWMFTPKSVGLFRPTLFSACWQLVVVYIVLCCIGCTNARGWTTMCPSHIDNQSYARKTIDLWGGFGCSKFYQSDCVTISIDSS